MINLQVKGIYDLGLTGKRAGLAIIMEDRFGNRYQANFITRSPYMDSIKKAFRRLVPLGVPRTIDPGELFTTA